MNCAVIGSGIGGLAAAIRLRVKGLDVDVFEANDKPGGELQERRFNNYLFGLGPLVFTMPHLIDELFILAGKNPRDYFSYTRLDPSFKYFYADGTIVNAYADVKDFEKELIGNKLVTGSSFEKYLKDVEAKFDITNE